MKKTLVFLLVLVMTVCAVFVLVPPVEAEAATLMTAQEFADICYEIATEYDTLYVMGCFGAPMNSSNKTRYTQNHSYNQQADRTAKINAASSNTFGFDCVCLIKGVLWGWNGDTSKVYGGATYASNGVSDMTISTMKSYCTDVTTDFSDLEVGEILFHKDSSGNYDHVGVYIGNGLAVESTPIWDDGVQVTAVANMGSKSGYNSRTWYSHGKLTTFLDYSFECDHEYGYQLDDYTHWEECTKCGDKKAAESHNFDFWRDGNGNIVITSGGSHGLRCTVCSGTKLEKHSYTCSICDDTCNVCGHYRTPKYEEFVFTYLNDGKHIQKCPECNTTTEKMHSVNFTIYYNDNYHWLFCYECNANVEVSEHNYVNSCTECKTCDYTRTATHTYDSDCDTTCNVCGNVRATSGHKYDDNCDTNCNLCGYTRTVTHTYTNSCDNTCNICGNVRNAGHTYSNDCDASCNYCGETREADHTYSNWTITQVATCISTGHRTRTCSKCGNTEGQVLDTTTHNFQKTKVDDEMVWKCTICGIAAAPDYDGSDSDETPTNDNKNKKSSVTEKDDSIKNALIFAGGTVAAIAAGGIGLALVKRPKAGTPKRAKHNGGSNENGEKSDEDND